MNVSTQELAIHYHDLEHHDAELREQLLRTLEAEYHANIQSLNQAGVLESAPELNSLGIRDAEGRFYAVPSFTDIRALCEKNWEMVQNKVRQGFVRLQLTPIALPLPRLFANVDRTLHIHADQKKLFVQKSSHSNAQELIQPRNQSFLSGGGEIRVPQQFSYFPDRFVSDYVSGVTKEGVILLSLDTIAPGWSVCLMQDYRLSESDRKNFSQIGRANGHEHSYIPDDFLLLMRNPIYSGESGWTIEDFLTSFLITLYETNTVSFVDFNQEGREQVVCLGAQNLEYKKSVPLCYWNGNHSELAFIFRPIFVGRRTDQLPTTVRLT